MSRTWSDMEDEAAALWVARHLGGMIDATAFNAWLAGGQGRRERFDALWATCMDPAVTDAADRVDHIDRIVAPETRRNPGWIAAGALGAVAAMMALFFSLPTIRFALTPTQDYATRVGEVRTIALSDGSRVTLSGASHVQVKLGGDRREVALQAGEAFFDVHHDATRPFTVNAGAGQATVLGTRFDVALDGTHIALSVEQGLVRFGARDAERDAVLVPANHTTALDAGRLEPVRALLGAPVAAWRDGWLETDDMPLGRLITELQRWSDRPIRIEDAALADKRVAGRFRLDRSGQQLDTLASLHGFHLQRSATEYVISSH